MGYSKKSYEPKITIEVRHNWHPDTVFAFTFPKRLPQAAVEAEARFLGLPDDARADENRRALIETIAEMVTKEPEGFDDFPSSATQADAPLGESLSRRFVAYFDDSEQIELEQILVSAWRAYRASSVPNAYPKSIQDSGKGNSQSSGATPQAQSGT